MSIDRRTLLLGLGGAAALVGCSTSGSTPVSVVYEILDSYRALERAKKQYPVTRADVDGQDLGVLGVQVEEGLKGFMLWSRRENGVDYWRSGNNVEMAIQNGRLIRTTGFPQDQLDSRVISGAEPLGSVLDPSQRYEVRRQLDYRVEPKSFEADYRLEYVRDVDVTLLEKSFRLAEWSETVRLPKTRRRWSQLIQVDRDSGQVWRSIQHIGPNTRVILELLKPPVI